MVGEGGVGFFFFFVFAFFLFGLPSGFVYAHIETSRLGIRLLAIFCAFLALRGPERQVIAEQLHD